jgi:hypothetical protein
MARLDGSSEKRGGASADPAGSRSAHAKFQPEGTE